MAANESSGGNPPPRGRPSSSRDDGVDSKEEGAPLIPGWGEASPPEPILVSDPRHPMSQILGHSPQAKVSNIEISAPPLAEPRIAERVDDLTEMAYIYTLRVPYAWLVHERHYRIKLLWWLIKFAFKATLSRTHA